MSTNTYNASTAVKTVFVRELREHLLKKSSLITLIIMAVGGRRRYLRCRLHDLQVR